MGSWGSGGCLRLKARAITGVGALLGAVIFGAMGASTVAGAATPSTPTTFSGTCNTSSISDNIGSSESVVNVTGTCNGSVDGAPSSTWTLSVGTMGFTADQSNVIYIPPNAILPRSAPLAQIELGASSSGTGEFTLCQPAPSCVNLYFTVQQRGDLFLLSGDTSGSAYLLQSPLIVGQSQFFPGRIATEGTIAG